MSTLQSASMHVDEKRAARQREIVTCPRDNGINKAGLGGTSLFVSRPSFYCIVLTSQESTSPVYYVCSVSQDRSTRTPGSSTSHSKSVEQIGRLNGHSVLENSAFRFFYECTMKVVTRVRLNCRIVKCTKQ